MVKAGGTFAGLVGASIALAATPAAGQQAAPQQVADSEQITVTATRTASDVMSVPSVVTVIDDEQIENNLVTDIKDLIRFEPGVSVRNSPSRFSAAFASTGRDGNSGFNIRGLEGNRVLIAIDGVRVPDGFSFGPAAFGRGDYVDLDVLSRVEIVRGPASALYGSDGLAGVVSFITKDPIDFLREDENFGARVRASYASADDSWAEGVSAAGRWGDWSAMAAYTRRDGREQENQGANESFTSARTVPNPQDAESNAAMARLVFQPSDGNRLRLTLDYGDRRVATEALSARTATVLSVSAVDASERQRIAFDHSFENEGGLIDGAFWSVYYQTAESSEFSAEDRTTTDRTRLTMFDNDIWGASGQAESAFMTGGASHRLIVGGDYSTTHQEGLRDGIGFPFGETFPTRPFPNTDFTRAGLFVQDEISFLDGSVSFFPALRYDTFKVAPEADALYPLPVADQSDSRITPRLGIVAWPTEHFGAFFNYAQGFKAPGPSDVNQSFTNFSLFYTSLPNPDLRPETSETMEVGLRFRDAEMFGANWRASATAFVGDYDDFIEQVQVSGPPVGTGGPGDLSVFQVVNFGAVTINGAEARVDGQWGNGFGVSLAASFAEGEQTEDGVTTPLDSIDPRKLVTGLSYDDPDGRFGGQFIVTYSAQKDKDDTAPGSFRPDAFAIFDLTAYWNITESATLRAGLFNATDETYWWWSDVRGNGLTPASPVLDGFTQPGRNFSASISYRF